MSEKWKTEKIGVTALCRVSAKGGQGIYLYIPKNFASAYRIVDADYAEVHFNRIFIKVAESADTNAPIDLRVREKKIKENK